MQSVQNVSSEQKMYIGIGFLSVLLIVGSYFFISKQDAKANKPLVGKEIPIPPNSSKHIVTGKTHPPYNSNPPTGGWMYDGTAGAGVHTTEVPDELLVHSLEHGAVILSYKSDLTKAQIDKIKKIFYANPGRTILVPRKNLDVPLALTSWGRLLKLPGIDEKQIELFIESNTNKAPEQAPI